MLWQSWAQSCSSIFGGVTDRLIPLYAVGAFLAFTLSQTGMVSHWRKSDDPRAKRYMMVNGIGAIATGLTVAVVLVAKFVAGAWITVILIPTLIAVMLAIKRHFKSVVREITETAPLSTDSICEPLVILAIDRWNKISTKGLRFCIGLSKEIRAVHVLLTRRRSTLYRFIGAATNLITERLPEALRGVALQELCERSAYIALCDPVMHHIDLAPASGFQQFLTSERRSQTWAFSRSAGKRGRSPAPVRLAIFSNDTRRRMEASSCFLRRPEIASRICCVFAQHRTRVSLLADRLLKRPPRLRWHFSAVFVMKAATVLPPRSI